MILLLYLALALTAIAGERPSPEALWSGPEVNALGVPSRDGQWFSVVDAATGLPALRRLSTGETKPLLFEGMARPGQFAYFSTISRDGKNLAYAWFNEEGFYELRIVPIPGEGESRDLPRTLFRNPESGFVQPCAFSPDGKWVLTLFFRRDNISQIALVSVADGEVRTLKSLEWIYPKRMDFSPDGRYVVYDNLSSPEAHERDLFLLSVDGARETRLLGGPENDIFPLWSATGDEVLFASDRGAEGVEGAWTLKVQDGQAVGEPKRVRGDMGRFLPLGVTDAGDLVYALRRGGLSLEEGSLADGEYARLFGESHVDRFAPAYSPDGRMLAYLTRVDAENYGKQHRAVVLREMPDGKEREVPDRLSHVERVSWSPAGDRLLLQGGDRRGRGGLFVFDSKTARVEPAVLDRTTDYHGVEGTFGPSGESVIFVRTGETAEIASRNLDSREDVTLYRAPAGAALAIPSLSPDGTNLVFAQLDASGKPSAWILRLGDLSTKKIFDLPSGQLTDLVWTADSSGILVGTLSSSGARLFRVSAGGEQLRAVASPKDRRPGVSVRPDGRAIVFAAGGTSEEIWILRHATAPAN